MRGRKRTFKHLTKNDRLRIERWLRLGLKPREIADRLRVHISTVYRELGRGQYERLNGETWEMETAYSPDIAEARYQAHLREKGPDLKIGNDHGECGGDRQDPGVDQQLPPEDTGVQEQ